MFSLSLQRYLAKRPIQLFERSRFANEIGAAIQLTPNANAALLGLGIDATTLGAVESEKVGAETATEDVKC